MAGRDMGQIRTINDAGIDNAAVQWRLLQKLQSKWLNIDTSPSSYLPQAPPRPHYLTDEWCHAPAAVPL